MEKSIFKATPFSDRIKCLNQSGRWTSWNDYMMPEVFQENGYDREIEAVRKTVVIEDKSPLTKYYFTGSEVVEFLNHLFPRDISKINDHHAVYTPICDHKGKMVMDGLLFRLPGDEFCYTAGCFDDWLDQEAQSYDVNITDRSEDFGILHVQGPKSLPVLQDVFGSEINSLNFSRGREINLNGIQLQIWRQGFTGEQGYELWVPDSDGNKVWDTIWEAGQSYGIMPFGHNSQDVARIEAGLIIPALDYTCACLDPETRAHAYGCTELEFMASPFELGLDRLIDLSKDDFVGKSALVDEISQGGPTHSFIGMVIEPQEILRLQQTQSIPPDIKRRVHRFPILQIFHEGDFIGHASSITWSPTVRKVIGFTRVNNDYAKIGMELRMEWIMGDQIGHIPISLIDLPFIKMKRE
jgi:aminomethyltransferase